jgi:hypothetical protein
MSTKTEGKAKPQPDIVPDPADMEDGGEPVAAHAEARPQEKERAAEPPVPPQVETPFSEARESIAQRYRELRDQEEAEVEQARAELEAEREAHQEEPEREQAVDRQPGQRVKVIIDGKEQLVDLDELVKG